MSFLVLLLPLVALAAGIAILVVYRPLWLSIPIAAIAFVIAWGLRPRPNRHDADDHHVSREAPRLYNLLDEVSAATNARPVTSVVLTAEAELWIAPIGWRMRPVVGIGLPLWAAMSSQQRIVIADTAYRGLEKALRFGSDVEPLEAVRRAVADIPAREIDRRIRTTRIRETRTDASHPPTYLRVKLIRARPTTSAKVVLGLSDSATIDRELAVAGAPALTELRRSFGR